MTASTRLTLRALFGFAVIYLVWGSTYLAIKFAVAEIPPLLTAGARQLVAGVILYAIARRHAPPPTRQEWRNGAVVGFLFFLVGHGTLHWAERFVPSGVAALFFATEPIWIVVITALFMRAATVTVRSAGGLVLGLVGVGLVLPWDGSGDARTLVGSLAILLGAASWSAGIVYASRAVLPRDTSMRAASTLLTGSAMLLVLSVAVGETRHLAVPSARAIGAWAYLALVGSVAAYGTYFWLLERYSPVLVATHTYVNPLVAVVLGWLAGGEVVGARLVTGAAVVVAAIALIGNPTRAPEGARQVSPADGGEWSEAPRLTRIPARINRT